VERERFTPTGTFIEFEWYSLGEDGVLDFTIDEFGEIHYERAADTAAKDSLLTREAEQRQVQLEQATATT
jgi:hypothetical protein